MVSTSWIGHSKKCPSRRCRVSLRCNTLPCTTSKTPITTSSKNINRRPGKLTGAAAAALLQPALISARTSDRGRRNAPLLMFPLGVLGPPLWPSPPSSVSWPSSSSSPPILTPSRCSNEFSSDNGMSPSSWCDECGYSPSLSSPTST
jgi:hypothetical protein